MESVSKRSLLFDVSLSMIFSSLSLLATFSAARLEEKRLATFRDTNSEHEAKKRKIYQRQHTAQNDVYDFNIMVQKGKMHQ
jgi:hypothetical protein